jgi:hypothetical protein
VKLEIVKFFDAKLAIFYFHFQMCAALQLAPAHDINWWLCAGPHLAMSTAKIHPLTVSGERAILQTVSLSQCFDSPVDETR